MPSLYVFHGILQAISFCFLYPIGATVAIFRDRVGECWKPIHIGFQLMASFLVFVAILLATVADRRKKAETKKATKLRKVHQLIGKTVVSLIILQILWAFFGRRIVSDWFVWYYIHVALSSLIITLGITNVLIAWRMLRKKEEKEFVKI